MMKARLAGVILLMGLSMAAQARTHTFVPDDEVQDARAGIHAIHIAAERHQAAGAGFDRGAVIKVHHDGMDDPFCGPIPEPGTYAMLLAGLGLMTTIARRKRMDR